jgi:hypothetical protein
LLDGVKSDTDKPRAIYRPPPRRNIPSALAFAYVNAISPKNPERWFLAALAQRLRAFWAFLCREHKPDPDAVLRRAEEQYERDR